MTTQPATYNETAIVNDAVRNAFRSNGQNRPQTREALAQMAEVYGEDVERMFRYALSAHPSNLPSVLDALRLYTRITARFQNLATAEAARKGIEAYGVTHRRAGEPKSWRKTFRDEDALAKWLDQNDGRVCYGVRDAE